MNYLFASLLGLLLALAAVGFIIHRRHLLLWLPAYLRQRTSSPASSASGQIHIMLCIADHFEPAWGRPSLEVERERVRQWVEKYPLLASRHRDFDGKPPQYSFFYPEEEYRKEHLDALAGLCKRGFGDVEVHLHHDEDTSPSLRKKLDSFTKTLFHDHGLLRKHPVTQQVEYAFIHGNWTLNNSGSDGRLCGVNDELVVLRETGCYADFTFPSAPSPTQTSKINSIYYASNLAGAPKSHDTGTDVAVHVPPTGDLMMIQGPLALSWRSRKLGILPRIENGELSGDNPPTPDRVDLWVRQRISVQGQPNWTFVKLYTHGANEKNSAMLLGAPMDTMFTYLETKYCDGDRYCLHYVTAREMYNIIKAAEAGMTGNPNTHRGFVSSAEQFRDSSFAGNRS